MNYHEQFLHLQSYTHTRCFDHSSAQYEHFRVIESARLVYFHLCSSRWSFTKIQLLCTYVLWNSALWSHSSFDADFGVYVGLEVEIYCLPRDSLRSLLGFELSVSADCLRMWSQRCRMPTRLRANSPIDRSSSHWILHFCMCVGRQSSIEAETAHLRKNPPTPGAASWKQPKSASSRPIVRRQSCCKMLWLLWNGRKALWREWGWR